MYQLVSPSTKWDLFWWDIHPTRLTAGNLRIRGPLEENHLNQTIHFQVQTVHLWGCIYFFLGFLVGAQKSPSPFLHPRLSWRTPQVQVHCPGWHPRPKQLGDGDSANATSQRKLLLWFTDRSFSGGGYPPGNDHISHLGKGKSSWKVPWWGYVSSREGSMKIVKLQHFGESCMNPIVSKFHWIPLWSIHNLS